jgi:phage terminase Nu1 subunit (DNA packaging protein)
MNPETGTTTPPSELEVSRRQLARIMGVTVNVITKYVERGMPVAKVGGGRGHESAFNLERVFAWWRDELSVAGKSTARDAYYAEITEKARLENALRRGEVHSIAECTAETSQLVTAAKEAFLGLSGWCRQVGLLTTTEAEDQLDAKVRDVLNELAKGIDAGRKRR